MVAKRYRDSDIDKAAKLVADVLLAGGSITVEVAPCSKCGGRVAYRSNPSPSWMNRWTCPHCGRHESR